MSESLPKEGRFVVLEHDHPFLHWDFMLECAGTLRTWRLPCPLAEGEWIAEPLPDHRLHYLDYEGPVSGGRGRVVRWDQGTYHVEGREGNAILMALIGSRSRYLIRIEDVDAMHARIDVAVAVV